MTWTCGETESQTMDNSSEDNGQQLRKPMAQSKSEVIRKRKQGVHCHLSINDERTCLGLHSCSNNICNIWETRGGVITITGKDSN
jgi:hypothetical protein